MGFLLSLRSYHQIPVLRPMRSSSRPLIAQSLLRLRSVCCLRVLTVDRDAHQTVCAPPMQLYFQETQSAYHATITANSQTDFTTYRVSLKQPGRPTALNGIFRLTGTAPSSSTVNGGETPFVRLLFGFTLENESEEREVR